MMETEKRWFSLALLLTLVGLLNSLTVQSLIVGAAMALGLLGILTGAVLVFFWRSWKPRRWTR